MAKLWWMAYLATVNIPYFTNIPTDVVVNTFNLSWTGTGDPGPTDFTNIRLALQTFWTFVFTPAGAVSMASWLNLTATKLKVYNLDQAIPRVPVLDVVMSMTCKQDTATTVPPEAAVCLSLKATPTPGVNPQSQRGRIFLGGLGNGAVTAGSTSGFVTVNSVMRTNLATAATNLQHSLSDAHWSWNILSRTFGLAFPVVGGFIDNAIDTQRRRANAATARTLWAI